MWRRIIIHFLKYGYGNIPRVYVVGWHQTTKTYSALILIRNLFDLNLIQNCSEMLHNLNVLGNGVRSRFFPWSAKYSSRLYMGNYYPIVWNTDTCHHINVASARNIAAKKIWLLGWKMSADLWIVEKRFAAIYLDLKKAFDSVDHSILLQKLSKIWICGRELELCISYLGFRTHSTRNGKFRSAESFVTAGIPQGSILGLLLFILFIDDLLRLPLISQTSSYADDTKLFCSGETNDAVKANLEIDLSIIFLWFQENNLALDTSKCAVMFFSVSNRNRGQPFEEIYREGSPIKSTETVRDLGLMVDSRLSFIPHVKRSQQLVARNLNMLWRNAQNCPKNIRRQLYLTFIQPHVDFCLPIWSTSAATLRQGIQKLLNSAARWVKGKGLLPLKDFMRLNQILTLEERAT